MEILRNQSLKQYNTFGIDANSAYLVSIHNVDELKQILFGDIAKENPLLILGGGSNILLTCDFNGLTILNRIIGIHVIDEDDEHVYVKVGAGEVWHNFVLWCIDKNYAGVENLSLIPGSVGAGPMQNIGAYGVELKEVFRELEALEIASGEIHIFSKEKCRFGYRDSIFKREAKGKYVITSVTFTLRKKAEFNTTYGAIETELKAMGVTELSIKAVSDAVCNIRRSKLPNPAEIGNAGSFFKNPEVSKEQYEAIKAKHADLVAYPTANGMKLAAGWLIEQSGLKGYRNGDAGVHTKQALVMVNYGGANGNEVYAIAKHVQQSVKEKFGVELEMEVNVL